MTYLLAGLFLFFGTHFVSIIAPAGRDAMVLKLGDWPFKGLYSLLAIAGFAAMVYGYGLTRVDPVMLYAPPTWSRHVAALLMVPVFPLLLASYLPGKIKAAAKHPMLAATKIWAFSHLLVNGMLGDVLLFGSFLTWAVLDRISLMRRTARVIPAAPASKANDAAAVLLGLVIYVVFVMWMHVRWIGVAPL